MKHFSLIGKKPLTMNAVFAIIPLCFMLTSQAQNITHVNDLTSFVDPGKTWKAAREVTADLDKTNTLTVAKGTGILVNIPDKKNSGIDLYTKAEFGDIDLSLDYMMAKGSNSGIYLHGRYELQLEDTWGSRTTTSGKNGGIYERWDDKRPEGKKGYGGHAPRQNASRAPGLWQHLEISFQAPRFNAAGEKIENAKILKAVLNGVLIHEDVDLPGPTRGGRGEESATGPLRLQGDHGAVAFRNIKIETFSQPRKSGEETSSPRRVYPILVTASTHPVFRSFMDLPDGPRVVHAVSVGSEENVHYTYDTDTGMLIQVWRGDFLDATPMWHSRGDGSSRPLGMVVTFGNPVLAIDKLSSAQSVWRKDTAGTGFRPKGYVLTEPGKPVFKYRIHGAMIDDAITTLPDGEGIGREITIAKAIPDLYFLLASSAHIHEMANGMYLVGDHYYLRIDEATAGQPVIRDINGTKELIMPAGNKVKYSILF